MGLARRETTFLSPDLAYGWGSFAQKTSKKIPSGTWDLALQMLKIPSGTRRKKRTPATDDGHLSSTMAPRSMSTARRIFCFLSPALKIDAFSEHFQEYLKLFAFPAAPDRLGAQIRYVFLFHLIHPSIASPLTFPLQQEGQTIYTNSRSTAPGGRILILILILGIWESREFWNLKKGEALGGDPPGFRKLGKLI